MLDQVQHDVVFVGHSGLDPESMGQRRRAGGEEPDAIPPAFDAVWMPDRGPA
ncbi:hypothetical protein [Inquilinus sp. CAU 1745]|uniref:hypothetical protein n=1 Tax=Inquilinus sp. CAU 1745 TaxID=3140369 RepID=UPI00325B2850